MDTPTTADPIHAMPGGEPPVTSMMGVELENERLKEELRKVRIKCSRLKHEVRRLHKQINLIKIAATQPPPSTIQYERPKSKWPKVDIAGNVIRDYGEA